MEWLQNTQTGNSKWWSWWLGLVVIVLLSVLVGAIPSIVLVVIGLLTPPDQPYMDMNPLVFAAVIFPNLMLFVGVWLAQRWVHGRTLAELTTAYTFRWSLVWQTMLVWLVVLIGSTAVEALLYPGRYELVFDAGKWILFAPVVLLLIPIQASGEELLFRGYLMQAVARLTRQPVVLIVISGVAFMVPHFANPEMSNAIGGEVPMALNYLVVGIGTAWLSVRDNGIERAIGMHVVNNLYAGIFVGYEGSVLGTPTIFSANVIDAWYGVVTLVIGFAILLFWPRIQPQRAEG
jgi:membrane protease YdiL (CAAX protease family)